MRIRCSGSGSLTQLVAVLRAVDAAREVEGDGSADVTLIEAGSPDAEDVLAKPRSRRVVRVRTEATEESAAPRAAGVEWIDLREAPRGPADDDLDRIANQAGHLAAALGVPVNDSPLLRSLRDDERRVRPGHAASLAEAQSWLQQVIAARLGDTPTDSFHASFVERLAPAMLPLSAMNAHFLAAPETNARVRAELRRFLDFVERRCPDARYASVQETFLNYRALYQLCTARKVGGVEFVHAEKYLHLSRWAAHKLMAASKLQLHERPPQSVLDLGAGPSHFGLVCDYFGHRYVGIDIPFTFTTAFSRHDMYGALFECLGMQRSLQRIEAFTPLQVSQRFELVTCLMGIFCTHRTPTGPVGWQWPEWEFFLRDLVQNVVTPTFELYLQLANPYLVPEVQAKLRALGASVEPTTNLVRITHAQADAILRPGS